MYIDKFISYNDSGSLYTLVLYVNTFIKRMGRLHWWLQQKVAMQRLLGYWLKVAQM